MLKGGERTTVCYSRIMLINLLVLTCLALSVEAANIPKDFRKKPGECPYTPDIDKRECPLPVGIQSIVAFNDFLMSIAGCLFDGDCPGTDKCCFDGCRTKCTSIKRAKLNDVHPGQCPTVGATDGYKCNYVEDPIHTSECVSDKHCKSTEKCCFDGCQVKCMPANAPSKIKQGRCPPVRASDGKKCSIKTRLDMDSRAENFGEEELPDCFTDKDCNSTSKCCSDGCEMKCTEPMLEEGQDQEIQPIPAYKKLLSIARQQNVSLEAQNMLRGDILADNATVGATESTVKRQNRTLALQRTFTMIKPDGVRRGLVGDIIGRFERKGYKLIAMKLLQPSKEILRRHYSYLETHSLIQDMIEYVCSGPVVIMAWQGIAAVEGVKRTLGTADFLTAAPGTIRFDFSAQFGRDIVHGSDNEDQAAKDIKLWFSEREIYDWDSL